MFSGFLSKIPRETSKWPMCSALSCQDGLCGQLLVILMDYVVSEHVSVSELGNSKGEQDSHLCVCHANQIGATLKY